MPNTLAHLGVQTLLTKAVIPQANSKWIGLGCLLPDIPWILQRLVRCSPLIDPLDLRTYTVLQSSFFFCLLLSIAIALLADKNRKVFLILALNSLVHLLLDACQIKWANGSLLLAPFSWELTSFAWFWPEEWPTLLLTLFGLFVFPIAAWRDSVLPGRHTGLPLPPCTENKTRFFERISQKKRLLSCVLLLGYFLLPLLFFDGPVAANNHYVATLKSNQRQGMEIQFDRNPYRSSDRTLLSYTNERFQLTGNKLSVQNSILSLRGQFLDNRTIQVTSYHIHHFFRDIASKIGIFLLGTAWLVALWEKRSRIGETTEQD